MQRRTDEIGAGGDGQLNEPNGLTGRRRDDSGNGTAGPADQACQAEGIGSSHSQCRADTPVARVPRCRKEWFRMEAVSHSKVRGDVLTEERTLMLQTNDRTANIFQKSFIRRLEESKQGRSVP